MPKDKVKRVSRRRWLDVIKQLSKLEPPRIEEQKQCFHTTIKKIIDDDFTYQCQNVECAMIFEIVGHTQYTPAQYAAKSMMINLENLDNAQVEQIMRNFVAAIKKADHERSEAGKEKNV